MLRKRQNEESHGAVIRQSLCWPGSNHPFQIRKHHELGFRRIFSRSCASSTVANCPTSCSEHVHRWKVIFCLLLQVAATDGRQAQSKIPTNPPVCAYIHDALWILVVGQSPNVSRWSHQDHCPLKCLGNQSPLHLHQRVSGLPHLSHFLATNIFQQLLD